MLCKKIKIELLPQNTTMLANKDVHLDEAYFSKQSSRYRPHLAWHGSMALHWTWQIRCDIAAMLFFTKITACSALWQHNKLFMITRHVVTAIIS